MDTKHMRDKVVDYTIQRLRCYGIRKIRMDDISNGIGMSKRTLYQLFKNKETLIGICLDILSRNGRRLLSRNPPYDKEEPVSGVLHIVNSYITTIYLLQGNLLSELESCIQYSIKIQQEKRFWKLQLMQALEKCREQFCPFVEEDLELLAIDILHLFYQNCINGKAYQSQLQLGCVLVRGLVNGDRPKDFDMAVQFEWKRLVVILENSWYGDCISCTST